MILALKILGGWLALALILAPVLIPMLRRRFTKHDDWVEQSRARQAFLYPQIRRRMW